MDRRTVLGLMGAAGAAPALLTEKKARAADELDPANPEDVLLMLRRLAHTTGDEPIFWWTHSLRMGLVDSQFTPLWREDGGSLFSFRDREDGNGYDVSVIFMTIYRDIERAKEIDSIVNPYTNKKVEIERFGGSTPIRINYCARGSVADMPGAMPPGYDITSDILVGPAWVEGDDVWVRTDNVVRMEPEDGTEGRMVQVNDWSTYHGSLADVANPDVASAPATRAFNDINTWPRSMDMGDLPGNSVARSFGRKVFSIDDMPESWKTMMAERHPDILNDPAGALRG